MFSQLTLDRVTWDVAFADGQANIDWRIRARQRHETNEPLD